MRTVLPQTQSSVKMKIHETLPNGCSVVQSGDVLKIISMRLRKNLFSPIWLEPDADVCADMEAEDADENANVDAVNEVDKKDDI
jgi:hypothetical protein